MKNILKFLIILIPLFFFSRCGDKLLDQPWSTTILLESQVWNDKAMITDLLANLYNRLPVHSQINSGETNYGCYDEGVNTGSQESSTDIANNNLTTYSYSRWTLWDYTYIRDLNQAIESIKKYSSKLTVKEKQQFSAELRFLRAYDYFEMVKRMGGVPIITTQLIYDFSGDPTYLRHARNTEEEVYDFIASELDAIKDSVGNISSGTPSKDRANKYSVLALKCRAMLYAGSIAKYNNLLATPITTPGKEVGLPAARSAGYYQASLNAAKEIINSGIYSLYNKNPNPGENFYEMIVKKAGNPEMIMTTDFLIPTRKHNWSYHEICRTMREDNLSSSAINPDLGLVEAFDYLDGTAGTLKGVGTGSNTAAGQTNWIFYDKPNDIFANKDARLYGTIVYPGTSFKGVDVEMQAGVYEWSASLNRYVRYESETFHSLYTDGKLLTGNGGPMRISQEVSNTGFYIKKFIDPATLSSARGVGTDIWWVRFRYGEVLLNAAEAAFELGGANITNALTYVNQIRQRAGFPANSLNVTTLTLAKLQSERRLELAYEDHRVWDLMRWRISHTVWNGSSATPSANQYALYPYRVIRPGHPNDGKYVFDRFLAPKFKAARFFQMGNYYSAISQSVLNNNPLIVKNPFH
ncbi:MAG: RagB/SusD family nutrient uptake outer membrane protein [Bacteroidales bacterium]|nr:RagB/SusD family nutrient uptake outer membrane protein [Bacteroidales bacterium]